MNESSFSSFVDMSKFVYLGRGWSGFIHGKYFDSYLFGSQNQDNEKIFSFDMDVLERLSDDGVEIICIWDIDRVISYETTLLEFQLNGVPSLHLGKRLHLGLPSSFWKITKIDIGGYEISIKTTPGHAVSPAGLVKLRKIPGSRRLYP